jgi:type VI secretion system secreted protein VgrG
MAPSQDDRIATVTTPLGDTDLLLYRVTGSEHLSQLFEYELELLSLKGDIDTKALLGHTMQVNLALSDGGSRAFHGVVTRIGQSGMMGQYYCYQAILRPKLWLLSRRSNCRIFQQKNVPDIVKALLTEHGYSDFDDKLTKTYPVRDFCVQYRESDFNFVSRLMEDEGIYYYFRHKDGKHLMVLCDDTSGAGHSDPAKQSVRYYPPENTGVRDEEHFYDWRISDEIQSGAFVQDDFNFEKPTTDLQATSRDPGDHSLENSAEVYDFPGNYAENQRGDNYAVVRMQELKAGFEFIAAAGNTRTLAVGNKFDFKEFPRSDQNQEYIVKSTHVQFQNNCYESQGAISAPEPYHCSYSVFKSSVNYKPSRTSRIPIVQGVQTAIVVGNSGDEITTDKYGRVKIQFHWDREGQQNENSSCWVRVAQVWAGKNWGGIHIPRIGQEVIVDFLEGNPDRPIITGRVYNADQMPPYDLDANKTQSGIKSRSTQSGTADNFNELRFEDKKGEEEVYLHAEKNFTRIVENDDKHTIGFDKKDPGDQTIDIYNNRTVTLDQGDDSLTVKTGDRSVVLEQGNDTLTLKMGNRTVKVDKGSISEEAMQSIELKVGSNSIKIDQSGITLKGLTIKIQADTTADLKGLTTTVSGDATLTVKGGVVMIN